jgi:hypothetical protein
MIELLGNTRSSSNSIYINYQLMLFLDSIKTCLKQKIDTIKIGRVSPKLYKINQGDEKESESDIEYYSQTRWYSIAIPFKNKALISVTSNSSEIEIGLRKWNEDDKRNNEYYEELEKSSKWSEIHSKYREGGDWWYFVRIDPFDDDYISQSSIERYVEELCEIYENLESISR